MRGDFTRFTFDPDNHYTSVRMQQGRVQLDADWNEQVDIQFYQQQAASAAFIGTHGAPKLGGGFEIGVTSSDLSISAGRYYVNGLLCEQPAGQTYLTQSSYPQASLPAAAGTYLVYLDVFTRHVTLLEDPYLREVGLSGPDTTTRTQTVWQVKLQKMDSLIADASAIDFAALFPPPDVTLAARAYSDPSAATGSLLAPGTGYQRLDNLLYRVEIHQGGVIGTDAVTYKWSRINGSIVAAWTGLSGSALTISYPGRDIDLGFSVGDWVELTDDSCELLGQPGLFVPITNIEGNVLTITAPSGVTITPPSERINPKVRLWDMGATAAAVTTGGWLSLEDGVQVRFSGTRCKSGDYWMIPARTAIRNVLWPVQSGQPVAMAPHGTAHAFAPLAQVQFDGTRFTLPSGNLTPSDLRFIFPSLVALRNVDPDALDAYLSGHEHTGGTDGPQIPRGGIADGAIDGTKIDPTAAVTVQTLTVSSQLSLAGRTLLNDHELYLRGTSDPNSGLGYVGAIRPWNGAAFDGPGLFGASGGVLGTVNTVAGSLQGAAVLPVTPALIDAHITLPTLPASIDFSQGLSVEAWINLTALSASGCILDLGNGTASDNIIFQYGSDGSLVLQIYSGTSLAFTKQTAAGAISVHSWHHVAATLDANHNVAIYVNGAAQTLSSSGTVAVPRSVSRGTCLLGKRNSSPASYLRGKLAQVRLWARALSSSEVSARVSSTLPLSLDSASRLVVYLPLDDGTGTQARDRSLLDASYPGPYPGTLSSSAYFESYQSAALTWDGTGGVALGGQLVHNGPSWAQSNNIYLASQGDTDSGLGYYDSLKRWNGMALRGPALFGHSGGALGTLECPVKSVDGWLRLSGGYATLQGGIVHDFSCGFTVEAWVYYDSVNPIPHYSRIIDFGNGTPGDNILLANNGDDNDLILDVYRGGTRIFLALAGGVLEAQTWMHLAATIDTSGNVQMYKNGDALNPAIVDGSVALPPTVQRNTYYIGKSHWDSDATFQGRIAHLRLWGRALSAAEINDHCSNQRQVPNTRLYGYWPFNEGYGSSNSSGALAADHSDRKVFAVLSAAGASLDTYHNTALTWDASGVTMQGTATIGVLNVSSAANLSSGLTVAGALALNNDLTVSGASTLSGALTVSGASTLNGALTISGASILNSALTVNSASTLNSALTVNGASTLNDVLTVNGATNLHGALTASGASTLNDVLIVSGAASLHDALSVSGASTLNSVLTVSGATTLGSALTVNGASTLNSSLIVNGATTLNSALTVNGQVLHSSSTWTQGSSIYLSSNTDTPTNSHSGLGYAGSTRSWNGAAVSGPVLFGAGGGVLGSSHFPAQTVEGSLGLSGGYATVPSRTDDFSGGFTVEAWVYYSYATTPPSNSRILDFGSGAGVNNILLGNSGTTTDLVFDIYNSTSLLFRVTASGAISSGTWLHFAVTIDANRNLVVYKNGSAISYSVTTGSVSLPPTASRTSNYIGKSSWAANALFSGKIAQVRLWGRALAAWEVSAHATNQGQVPTTSLRGHWPFNEGTGAVSTTATAYDRSGNSQNATVTAAATLESYQYTALSWDSSNNVAIAGTTTIGTATASASLVVNGALTATGNATIGSSTSNASTVNGSLTVTGNATLGSSTSNASTVNGSLTVTGKLIQSGNTRIYKPTAGPGTSFISTTTSANYVQLDSAMNITYTANGTNWVLITLSLGDVTVNYPTGSTLYGYVAIAKSSGSTANNDDTRVAVASIQTLYCTPMTLTYCAQLSAGTYTFSPQWKVSSSTATLAACGQFGTRSMILIEL